MVILFQNTLLLKEFIACNGCFWLFIKIKKESGDSFWCTFSVWYQTKCVIKFLLIRQFMTSWILRLFLHQALGQWLTEKEGGEDENTKIWISRKGKELFRWNKKTFFIVFEGLPTIWWKIKIRVMFSLKRKPSNFCFHSIFIFNKKEAQSCQSATCPWNTVWVLTSQKQEKWLLHFQSY